MNPQLRESWIENIDYHLIGFLCIDTEDVFSGYVSQFDSGIELAKALADILYTSFQVSEKNKRLVMRASKRKSIF